LKKKLTFRLLLKMFRVTGSAAQGSRTVVALLIVSSVQLAFAGPSPVAAADISSISSGA
jgi:hypothetical protein